MAMNRVSKSSSSFFTNFSNEKHRKLLLRKGVYPHDYVNSLEKLEETALPSKEAFYSKLYTMNLQTLVALQENLMRLQIRRLKLILTMMTVDTLSFNTVVTLDTMR